jgi:hypothetical protein
LFTFQESDMIDDVNIAYHIAMSCSIIHEAAIALKQ